MLERPQLKALPLLNRAADVAPALQACCGVCRTCATTNAVTFLIAVAAGAAGFVARAAGRGRKPLDTV